jgi:hypothetical protein
MVQVYGMGDSSMACLVVMRRVLVALHCLLVTLAWQL